MNVLKFYIDENAEPLVKKQIIKILAANGVGIKYTMVEVPINEADLIFIRNSEKDVSEKAVSICLNSNFNRSKYDAELYGQPELGQLLTAGLCTWPDVRDTISKLDSVGEAATISHESEEKIFEDDTILEKYSHVFVDAPLGPLLSHILVMFRTCLTMTNCLDAFGPKSNDWEDFKIKVEAITNEEQSSSMFYGLFADNLYTTNVIYARGFRSIIGSLLKTKLGNDYGFLDFNIGDTRLADEIKRKSKRNDDE